MIREMEQVHLQHIRLFRKMVQRHTQVAKTEVAVLFVDEAVVEHKMVQLDFAAGKAIYIGSWMASLEHLLNSVLQLVGMKILPVFELMARLALVN